MVRWASFQLGRHGKIAAEVENPTVRPCRFMDADAARPPAPPLQP
jgi:hypothetical protein